MNESIVSNNQSTSDPAESRSPSTASSDESAGAILKKAREEAGLHIAALAAALKVPVRKLEALEANRWDELTDPTFTRALASSVARHLKLDPSAVLLAMPTGKPVPLVISSGLGNAAPPRGKVGLPSVPVLGWVIAALLLTALGTYFLPTWWPVASSTTAELTSPASSSSTAKTDVVAPPDTPTTLAAQVQVASESVTTVTGASKGSDSVPAVAVETQQNKPMPGETPPAAVSNQPTSPSVGSAYVDSQKSAATAPVSSGGELVLLIKANSDTWAEVTDDTKRVRVQRLLKAGEEQSFNGASSFSVVLGNAMAAQVFVRGQPVDLMARSKNNVARFDVK